MDRITPEQRSFTMSRIKGKNTKPELVMFEALEEMGIKFKRHYKLLGSPDIVFPKEKIVVFIDGDFWHGKDFHVRKDKLPEYWVKKINMNMRRDRRYRSKLRSEGWKVIRFWDDRVIKRTRGCIKRVLSELEKAKQE